MSPRQYVHIGCLEEWRRACPRHESTVQCEHCSYSYRFKQTSLPLQLAYWGKFKLSKRWSIESFKIFLFACTLTSSSSSEYHSLCHHPHHDIILRVCGPLWTSNEADSPYARPYQHLHRVCSRRYSCIYSTCI